MHKQKVDKVIEPIVLTGNPAEDFGSFLKARTKSFEHGLELIKKYTDNRALYNYLLKRKDDKKAKQKLIYNIEIISLKWLKK